MLNVFYTRATLDKINWAGMYGDGIWEIRDGGFIPPGAAGVARPDLHESRFS
ncbi:MAG: hypothetical protein U5N53_11090 [Mycobacterium sp.]|nr:hypothetical protein [Mycobacterium sp.]